MEIDWSAEQGWRQVAITKRHKADHGFQSKSLVHTFQFGGGGTS